MPQSPLDRIDALAGRPSRAPLFGGDLLLDTEDTALQQVVEAAASELRSPIALVSLVLDRIQLFRAHVGLPPDLASARATDRDVSFCQFVVRDGEPFAVGNALGDTRVPQELVRHYGIRSYLGTPVRAGDEVVGSLCVIDVEEREFDDDDRASLARLAERASQRLTELRRESTATQLLAEATSPVFAELRNLMTPLVFYGSALRLGAAELRPLVRLAAREEPGDPAWEVLARCGAALDEIDRIALDLPTRVDSIGHSLDVMQQVASGAGFSCDLRKVVSSAQVLVNHVCRPAGGLRWAEEVESVEVAGAMANVCFELTRLLARLCDAIMARNARDPLAERDQEGILARADRDGERVVVTLSAEGLGADAYAKVAAVDEDAPSRPSFTQVSAADDGVRLELRRVSSASL